MFVPGETAKRGPKQPHGVTRELVRELLARGLTQAQVAVELNVVSSTVAYHARNLDKPADPRFARRFDWAEIRRAYEGGLSYRQCKERYGFSRDAWYQAVRRGEIVLRQWYMPIEELLVVGRKTSRGHLKARLIKEGLKEERCDECGITEWRGRRLSLHLHHVNGDGLDNRLENLAMLCANCHSLTDTYAGRNSRRRPDPVEPQDRAA